VTGSEKIGLYSAIWIALFAITFVGTLRRRNAVGLTATFLLTFMANHWLGSALYVLPWDHRYPDSAVAAGLQQSLWGMAAFAFGALALSPVFTKGLSKQPPDLPPAHQAQRELPRRIRTFALIGMSFYILRILVPFMANISSFSTFTHVLTEFTVFAAYLFIYMKMRTYPKNTWRYVILIAALWPVAGILSIGFASFASVIGLLMITFYLSYNRINIKKFVFLLGIAYLGLSGYVVYMSHRNDLRASVWGQESLGSRMKVLMDTARGFELFSLGNPDHLYLVDVRLNRNYYVGLAALRLDAGAVDYAGGQTFLDALIAPIPRALWPGKPRVTANNEMMTRFTGLVFLSAAGSGPLLEGLVNFGSAGVIGLFACYGLLLGIADAQARRSLDAGRYFDFALWSLPLIDLLDNVQSTGSIVASIIASVLVFKVLQYHFEGFRPRRPRTSVDRAPLPSPRLAERLRVE
jgi:hypothetical protein